MLSSRIGANGTLALCTLVSFILVAGSMPTAALAETPSGEGVSLSSLAVTPATVPSGGTATVTVTLSGAAVSMASRDPYAFPMGNTFTMPAAQTSGSFTVQAGPVTASTTVTVQAGYNGPAQSATVTVNPVPVVSLSAISVSPSTLTSGGTATVTLTLSDAAPAGGASVTVYSQSPAALPVPASFVIAAGQTSGSFTAQAGGGTASAAFKPAAGDGDARPTTPG